MPWPRRLYLISLAATVSNSSSCRKSELLKKNDSAMLIVLMYYEFPSGKQIYSKMFQREFGDPRISAPFQFQRLTSCENRVLSLDNLRCAFILGVNVSSLIRSLHLLGFHGVSGGVA